MGNQESDRSVRSLEHGEFVDGCAVADIYNHRKDGFVSDEIVAYAEGLTKGMDL
jgi:hypothetical protein